MITKHLQDEVCALDLESRILYLRDVLNCREGARERGKRDRGNRGGGKRVTVGERGREKEKTRQKERDQLRESRREKEAVRGRKK